MPIFTFLLLLICALVMQGASPAAARILDGPAILHQAGNANMCAVTFDDGPSQFTGQLLDSLQREGIRVTFFVLGRQVERHPDLIRRMVAEGHEVGSHSYSHPNFRKLTPEEQWWQLTTTINLLTDLGARPVNFRPPYGKYSDITSALADELGLSIVLWSSDSQDWKRRPVDYSQMRTVTGRPALPGQMHGIFLFHDIRRATVEDVSRIIATLRAGGCERFVTVREYMDSDFMEAPLYTAVPPAAEDSAASADNSPLTNPVTGGAVAETSHEEDELMAQSRPVDANLPTADKAPRTSPSPTSPHISAGNSNESSVPLARSSQPWPWSLFNSGT